MARLILNKNEFCSTMKQGFQQQIFQRISPFRNLSCGSASVRAIEPLINKGDRRASVALVIRHNLNGLEVLFIKRTENPRDPWSGDIALPGGRQDDGETDLETAIRECREEVGLDLTSGGFSFIGQLDDRIAKKTKTSKVILSSFVFLDEKIDRKYDKLKIQENEVAAAWWVNIEDLLNMEPTQKLVPITRLIKPLRNSPTGQGFVKMIGLDVIGISGIKLPPPSNMNPETDTILWGLTLGILCDLLKVAGKEPKGGVINTNEFSFPNTFWVLNKPTQIIYSVVTNRSQLSRIWIPGIITALVATLFKWKQEQ